MNSNIIGTQFKRKYLSTSAVTTYLIHNEVRVFYKLHRSIFHDFFTNPIVLTQKLEMAFCYQNCSSDREKLLKFEAEGREFSKFLRSLEQFIQTVKGQNNFW